MKILLTRLSAMGDVAMVIPLAYAVARANPEHHFTLLTQPFLTNLLVEPPSNLEGMAIDIRREERGLWGLLRYGGRLRRERFDLFIDLHDVLRTKLLRAMSLGAPTKILALKKPRAERKRLLDTRPPSPITPMSELYRAMLVRAGLTVPEQVAPILPRRASTGALPAVGIAPFASTESKTYDLSLMQEVVKRLADRGDCEVILFGGRGREADELERWVTLSPRVRSVAGTLSLSEELYLISSLSCMVSMDSANMHMASMVGVPVVSLWCATHPAAGFLGWGQSLEDCLGDESLSCRPCSIFGKVKRCVWGDMPCRRGISPERIEARVHHYLQQANTDNQDR